MSNAVSIVDDILVPHTAFEKAQQTLEQCYKYAENAREPTGVAIIGESRTGKSRVIEEMMARHPTERDKEGLRVPILRVTAQSKPTVKGLAEILLKAMGDSKFAHGTENQKTARLMTLMKGAETRMVVVDEFQHFEDKVSHKVTHHVADWLKILVDETKLTLVVAGLPSCQAVLEQNEQLRGRFQAPIMMPRFAWYDADQQAEFIGILNAFYDGMRKYFDLPELGNDQMAFRCYCATGGLIGYLTNLLRKASRNAVDSGQQTISLDDLRVAHREAMWSSSGSGLTMSPFDPDFQFVPSEELLSNAAEVGVPKQPVAVAGRSRGARRSRRAEPAVF